MIRINRLTLILIIIVIFLGVVTVSIIVKNNKATAISEPVQPVFIDYSLSGNNLELPVIGATGYTAMVLPLYTEPDEDSSIITILVAGRGFTIIEEVPDFWFIESENVTGWVKNHFCMINIPDVIPSIVHNNTNTYSSLFKTSGYSIPGITGEALYNAKDFNARLGKEEFIAPVLYGMVRKIFLAQQAALKDDNTLVIYEAFRPAEPHNKLFDVMSEMAKENPVIYEGLTGETFRLDLFLAPSPYNHQRGTAIDVTLAKVISAETKTTGNYMYTQITQYAEYPMQSPMHELSIASAIFKKWVNARTFTGWHSGEFADNATDASKLLQKYCIDAGLTPLASEWWHFNDLNWSPPLVDVGMTGEFFIEKTFSRSP